MFKVAVSQPKVPVGMYCLLLVLLLTCNCVWCFHFSVVAICGFGFCIFWALCNYILWIWIGVDPKSILCEFFKAGQCTKGFKCKFSHDLNVQRKGEKIDIYSDKRDGGE